FALGHIAELVVSKAPLTPPDAEFLEAIRLACEYETGRIDRNEYTRRADDLAQSSTTSLRLHHKLERVRMQFLGENDALQRSALLASLQAICAEIERDPSTPA